MNTKASYAAIGLMIASIALSIACMSTLAWVVDESGTTTLSIGLKKYKQESPRETLTGTLKELQVRYPLARKLADGGDSVLACGIVSMVLILISIIMVVIHVTGRPEYRLHVIAAILLFVSCMITCLGDVLYAQELNLGASFILYTFNGPLSLSAACLLTYAIVSGGPSYVPRKATAGSV